LGDVLLDRAADFPTDASMTSMCQPHDRLGKLGFNPRADVN
jgi:hypothetical protein